MQIETSIRGNHHQVSSRAQSLWEQAGRPEGRDLEFWLQAEAEIVRETETAVPLCVQPTARRNRALPAKKQASRAGVSQRTKAGWES